MTKAEMEYHFETYKQRMVVAHAAADGGLFSEAITNAISAWEHIEGMIQYRKKYLSQDAGDIYAIDIVLELAPFLLDLRRLDDVRQLTDSSRKLNSDTTHDKLDAVRTQLLECHRLWTFLEQHPEIKDDELWDAAGAERKSWQSIIRAWIKSGLVARTPIGGSNSLAITTRLGQIVQAKCPHCGKVAQGPKAMFLEPTVCPECKIQGLFVLLTNWSGQQCST